MGGPTTKEIRVTFFAMLDRLEEDALTISDEIVGKAKLVHLELLGPTARISATRRC